MRKFFLDDVYIGVKEKLGETTFTKQLANAFWDKLFAHYSEYNGGRENTTKDFKKYNRIYP